MSVEEQKRVAGRAAAALVESRMRVGLGSGSTAKYATVELGRRLSTGVVTDVAGIPTSEATATLAIQSGIPLTELDDRPIDLAIDGADEIAPNLSLIKGAGGALLREKIVAAAARVFVVVADASKLVDTLGVGMPVPIEIAPFGHRWTLARLAEIGEVAIRRGGDGDPVVTDNGNLIADLKAGPISEPASLDRALASIPGVLATGLFYGMTTKALVADDSTVHELRPEDTVDWRP